MNDNTSIESIKGDRSMSQGFVAQYAAEAALQIDGVASLSASFGVALKEMAGVVHEGKGVRVVFHEDDDNSVSITVFPVVYYGKIIPEVAWAVQERIKADVERFTGLDVDSVDVHVCGVVTDDRKINETDSDNVTSDESEDDAFDLSYNSDSDYSEGMDITENSESIGQGD